jgi:hypothetical protein
MESHCDAYHDGTGMLDHRLLIQFDYRVIPAGGRARPVAT